ncbi:hypothetical protein [Burkholderia cepacia]|uniref:hypothetical protein n=1 Tax=Burkholderia cepacia TaxID=292 RepID=UPI001CF2643E|nr:hypothetical protein [Burkholderia cepacia]MCA8060685.1 hypothetical protein [Burkholderia cepacia]
MLIPENMPAVTITPDLYRYLPKSARELVDMLGSDLATKIILKFGGVAIDVPATKVPRSNSRNRDIFIDALGEEGFSKLVDCFGSATLEIPLCDRVKRMMIWREMIREFDALTKDCSSRYARFLICVKFQITDRQLRRVLDGKYPV